MSDKSCVLYPNVVVGGQSEIGEFSIIGQPYKGMADEEKTVIGKGANIRTHTVIYAGNQIGENFQTGHGALLRECNTVGNDVSVGSKAIVEHHVTIDDGVRIHSQAFVPEYTHLMAGCWIGPNVVLTNARYPLSDNVKQELAGPVVEAGAKIGANATVLPGLRIGANSLVGAGSVVTEDVPPGTVVAGNPARVINTIDSLPYGGEQ